MNQPSTLPNPSKKQDSKPSLKGDVYASHKKQEVSQAMHHLNDIVLQGQKSIFSTYPKDYTAENYLKLENQFIILKKASSKLVAKTTELAKYRTPPYDQQFKNALQMLNLKLNKKVLPILQERFETFKGLLDNTSIVIALPVQAPVFKPAIIYLAHSYSLITTVEANLLMVNLKEQMPDVHKRIKITDTKKTRAATYLEMGKNCFEEVTSNQSDKTVRQFFEKSYENFLACDEIRDFNLGKKLIDLKLSDLEGNESNEDTELQIELPCVLESVSIASLDQQKNKENDALEGISYIPNSPKKIIITEKLGNKTGILQQLIPDYKVARKPNSLITEIEGIDITYYMRLCLSVQKKREKWRWGNHLELEMTDKKFIINVYENAQKAHRAMEKKISSPESCEETYYADPDELFHIIEEEYKAYKETGNQIEDCNLEGKVLINAYLEKAKQHIAEGLNNVLKKMGNKKPNNVYLKEDIKKIKTDYKEHKETKKTQYQKTIKLIERAKSKNFFLYTKKEAKFNSLLASSHKKYDENIKLAKEARDEQIARLKLKHIEQDAEKKLEKEFKFYRNAEADINAFEAYLEKNNYNLSEMKLHLLPEQNNPHSILFVKKVLIDETQENISADNTKKEIYNSTIEKETSFFLKRESLDASTSSDSEVITSENLLAHSIFSTPSLENDSTHSDQEDERVSEKCSDYFWSCIAAAFT